MIVHVSRVKSTSSAVGGLPPPPPFEDGTVIPPPKRKRRKTYEFLWQYPQRKRRRRRFGNGKSRVFYKDPTVMPTDRGKYKFAIGSKRYCARLPKRKYRLNRFYERDYEYESGIYLIEKRKIHRRYAKSQIRSALFYITKSRLCTRKVFYDTVIRTLLFLDLGLLSPDDYLNLFPSKRKRINVLRVKQLNDEKVGLLEEHYEQICDPYIEPEEKWENEK